MKKVIVGLIVIIFIIIGIKVLPLGTKDARMGASLVNMKIPKLSSISSECCDYEATFKTIRGKKVIEKELDKIMSGYQIILCNEKKYYYDVKNDITILDYDVEGNLLSTKFHISYVKGYACSFE